MSRTSRAWDYLVVTASNALQASAYERQLDLRKSCGLFDNVAHVLVVPDPDGRRIGSGGSTIRCLLHILERELAGLPAADRQRRTTWKKLFEQLRILVIHAGGDSKRLPAYAACGKVFVPLPVPADTLLPPTLFDKLWSLFQALSDGNGAGRLVIAAGDVLLDFDPATVSLSAPGVTGLGCLVSPEIAMRHGVFCTADDGTVRKFLQKPSLSELHEHSALSNDGRAVVDMGVFQFDPPSLLKLFELCEVATDRDGRLCWTGLLSDGIEAWGLDFYREIACALGGIATRQDYEAQVRASGSCWTGKHLDLLFDKLSGIPFHAHVLQAGVFLHFGTTRQLIGSGHEMFRIAGEAVPNCGILSVTSETVAPGRIDGTNAWVEGCRICAALTVPGDNVVVGLDVDEPLSLRLGACVDVARGTTRTHQPACFVRCYGVDDAFQETLGCKSTFCSRPIDDWLRCVGATSADLWEAELPETHRTLWTARLFPAEEQPDGYQRWLWMHEPQTATAAEHKAWIAADRYSLAEMSHHCDGNEFFQRRLQICGREIARTLRQAFAHDSGFSAAELALLISDRESAAALAARLPAEIRSSLESTPAAQDAFRAARMLHSFGFAIESLAATAESPLAEAVPDFFAALSPADRAWFSTPPLSIAGETSAHEAGLRLRAQGFESTRLAIVRSVGLPTDRPVCGIRRDEIVWGRAPLRLDLAGGWTDTPPYSLEFGGSVLNVAVNLNGQPPVHVYAKLSSDPLIRISSIDGGNRLEIRDFAGLLNRSEVTSEFALVKTALVDIGFSPGIGAGAATLEQFLHEFGGGLEITTIAALPKGSGLGTSSILGAVVLAVLHRMVGRILTPRELFHATLRLEQQLTTGGGWQDQVGGVVPGLKLLQTEPGLIPDVCIQPIDAALLQSAGRSGQILLYYTGCTRLAKDILQKVVGRYLNRDRSTLATLQEIGRLPLHIVDALTRRELPRFGHLIAKAWNLNKRLDPAATNDEVELLMARIAPFIHGAKLLGAGGGGFMVIVCKSKASAQKLREHLEANPPNPHARFFDFNVNCEGLSVSVC